MAKVPRGVRSPRSTDTREKLLAATTALIAEVGWNGVTTRLAAERAGLAPGLVHYHFASVDDLRRQAARSALHTMFGEPMQRLLATASPAVALRQMADELAGWDADGAGFALLVELMLATLRQPDLQPEFAAVLGDYRRVVADWLADHGVADAGSMAGLVLATLDGVLLHRLVDPDVDVQGTVGPLVDLLETRTGGTA